MSQLMIDAQQVCKNYGRLEVLKGIDLQVPKGTVTCLIGPSGSGKSTMLRCVNHLEKVNAGRLYVDGDLIGYRERDGVLYEISEKDAAKQRSDIGMVFQNFNLFPHRTVIENIIEAPIHVKKQPESKARARAMELLEQVGLAHKADATPSNCRVVSSSALQLPAPSPWSQSSCFSTNPPALWTLNSSVKSCE